MVDYPDVAGSTFNEGAPSVGLGDYPDPASIYAGFSDMYGGPFGSWLAGGGPQIAGMGGMIGAPSPDSGSTGSWAPNPNGSGGTNTPPVHGPHGSTPTVPPFLNAPPLQPQFKTQNSGLYGVPGYKWVGKFPATSQASTSAPPWAGSLHPSLPGWKNPYYPGDKSVDPSSDPYSDEPGFSFGDNFTHDAPNSDGFQAGFRLYFGGNGNNLSIGGAGNTSQYFNFFNPLGTGLFGGFGTGFSYGNKSNPLTGLGHTEDMSPTPPEYYGY